MRFFLLLTLLSCTTFNYSLSQSWFTVESGTNIQLNTIDFPSNTVGYIGGNNSLLLKTTNGGITWEEVNYSVVDFIPDDLSDRILHLQFLTETLGYMSVGPYSNGIYKTVDGGENWTNLIVDEGFLCFNYGFHFLNEDNGFSGGADCFTPERIRKHEGDEISFATLHGLDDWNPMIVAIDFHTEDYGIAISGNGPRGRILRTIDGGENWYNIPDGLPEEVNLSSVKIINDTLAYIGYKGEDVYGLIKSTNGGTSWSIDTEIGSFVYRDIHTLHHSGDGSIYAGASSIGPPYGMIFKQSPESAFWYTSSFVQPIYGIGGYGDDITWGVGDSGLIVVNKDPDLLSIETNKVNTIDQIIVYPNPSTEAVTIVLPTISTNDYLTICDTKGKMFYQQSIYSPTLLIENLDLDPGVYLLNVFTNNQQKNLRIIRQ